LTIKPTLVLTFVFQAKRQRVFDVLTQAEHLNRWFTKGAQVDLQVGGQLTTGEGERFKFAKVAVPRQLVSTYSSPRLDVETEVDMTLESPGPLTRTMLRIVQKGLDPEQVSEEAYRWMTDRWNFLGAALKRYLDRQGRISFEAWQQGHSPVYEVRK